MFKVHSLLHHSTLGPRVVKKKMKSCRYSQLCSTLNPDSQTPTLNPDSQTPTLTPKPRPMNPPGAMAALRAGGRRPRPSPASLGSTDRCQPSDLTDLY